MRTTTTPILETIEQFRDLNDHLWCVQLYYPKGKRNGNAQYWIGYLANIKTGESIPFATLAQLNKERLARGRMTQMELL